MCSGPTTRRRAGWSPHRRRPVRRASRATHNRGGALAVLYACQTAAGGLVNPDEAITLATALQFGGWRAVVGTLWPVGDAVAVKVTRRFYDVLLGPAGSTPAHALHEAVRRMRERYPNHPSMWAPFVHVGA